MQRTIEQWRATAVECLRDFLDSERAFVVPELEAKLADQRWGEFPAINPHHLTTARLALQRSGEISVQREQTRGKGWITTYSATSRVKEAARRAARKRLLYSRYLGWTRETSDWNPAPIPAALERVIHVSLTAAAPHGYRLLAPGGGEVRSIFGERVPGGPVDNAAFHTALQENGLPGATTLVPIEAKNIRAWVYPRTQELFQLLDKSASLHERHPEVPITPVFVCRRLQATTAWMAQQMGFHVIETKTQYVRPVVIEKDDDAHRKFDEVNNELGFNLTAHESEVAPMVSQFAKTLPRRMEVASERWAVVADHPRVPDLLAQLRDEEVLGAARLACIEELGQSVQEATGEDVRWTSVDRPDDLDDRF
ncbi:MULTISPECIES: hypothetical protein [unclassified Rathayibacter]|uniref:hypothetical protein n=1 Tax=unclassified Rathayibacter TaxID=2609250 RepID=UPI000F4D14E3|nr:MULTISPECIES: hypothetical protein [unclassified Rathayibacter]